MRYSNTTPFPTLCFQSNGPEGPIHTIVVRATTRIVPGGLLSLADEQLPLNFTDRYFGRPGASSLKYPNDLAPFKPMTDIILVATAYPPKDSAGAWIVGVKVGQHTKSLVVTGPRLWRKTFLFGWQPSPLKPAPQQPIRYENAFGGVLSYIDKDGDLRIIDACRNNPVGKGWVSPLAVKVGGEMETFPAPQFFSSRSDLPPVYGKEYAVEGLGAIATSWSPRQKHLGTWRESDGDANPVSADLNFLFYNSAHPDLVVPYLEGDETVQLFNLTPDGRLDFGLPAHTVFVAATFKKDRTNTVPAFLDTLIIEPDEMRSTLVWRATVPVQPELDALEARLVFNEKAAEKESIS